jgi:hypothetical protein
MAASLKLPVAASVFSSGAPPSQASEERFAGGGRSNLRDVDEASVASEAPSAALRHVHGVAETAGLPWLHPVGLGIQQHQHQHQQQHQQQQQQQHQHEHQPISAPFSYGQTTDVTQFALSNYDLPAFSNSISGVIAPNVEVRVVAALLLSSSSSSSSLSSQVFDSNRNDVDVTVTIGGEGTATNCCP